MRIEIPKTCSACEYPLVMVGEHLFCKNTACTARLDKQIEHFTKTLGIKGFGAKTVEKLNLADITELYYLDREEAIEKLGSTKVVDKLLEEIEASKSSSLDKVLASFSIPLIGNTAAVKICAVVDSIDDITPETCKQAGLGEKATYNLTTWLDTVFIDLREFLPFSFKAQKNSVIQGGKTICITGKLKSYKTKAEAYAAIGSAGFKVVESVTKTTDYLVDEDDKQSAKRTKADTLGITIISNLISFIKENTND